MSDIVLGCDTNGVHDQECQNTIASILEKAGNSVEKLSIGPNHYASYSYSNKASGKIGVFIMADGIFSIADACFGNTSFKYNYFIIRGDLGRSKMDSQEDFENNPIGRDADCSSVCNKIAGKTYPQMNDIIKDKGHVVFGTTCEEMGNAVVKAMGGDTGSDSKSSGSSVKDAIKEVLYAWNGDAYCYIQDDTVHIGRIQDPTNTNLTIAEGDNVYYDSISVTDIDPSAPNKLIVEWGDDKFIIQDDERIKRFGEVSRSIEASYASEEDVISFAYREWNKLLKESKRVLECRVRGDAKWRNGRWVRVYIPSFNLNGFMFITKCSHDDSGEWDTNLTLTDYPPDLGKKPSKTENESNEGS